MKQEMTIDDSAVIGEIIRGDKNRYAVLMQKYNQRLYRICKAYLSDEAEIEDVMQETYIKAYTSLRSFEGRSSFGTWISRILINETLQRLRSMKKTGILEESDKARLVADHTNPENKSMNKELKSIIEKNIDALPENYRIVFIMREVEKANVAETAEILAISESNVKVRLNRAKEMLKRSLLQSYPLAELYDFNLVRCARVANNVLSRISSMILLDKTAAG
jgi:RNA polymerase sigma factor (sigma-70 family)